MAYTYPKGQRPSARRKSMGRKLRGRDGAHWTPTEDHRKDKLMRQFLTGDGPRGNSKEYTQNYAKIDWSKGGTPKNVYRK